MEVIKLSSLTTSVPIRCDAARPAFLAFIDREEVSGALVPANLDGMPGIIKSMKYTKSTGSKVTRHCDGHPGCKSIALSDS